MKTKRIKRSGLIVLFIPFLSFAMEGQGLYVFQEPVNVEFKAQTVLKINEKQLADIVKNKVEKKRILYKKSIGDKKTISIIHPQSHGFSQELYGYIESRDFPETYALIEKGIREKIFSPLSSKLSDVLSRKISSVEEFCKDLIEFPKYTGAMAIAIAHFVRNEKFLSDYKCKSVLARISTKDMVPIMFYLVKNLDYQEANLAKNGSVSNSSLFSANDM